MQGRRRSQVKVLRMLEALVLKTQILKSEDDLGFVFSFLLALIRREHVNIDFQWLTLTCFLFLIYIFFTNSVSHAFSFGFF